ncbi:MAG TPA: UDP-3-O-acyl-N-acetylglucosamine deacetylase [Fimbriiglobus sp.]|jgi:UDP-3-O-acyl N-acetylglucosamine deacetylase
MRLLGYRYQRTLARSVAVDGPGFITGACIRARFHPAPVDAGVVFVRTDRPEHPPIPARIGQVTDTRRRTTLGPATAGVTLVEHVLAALAGLRIDNCVIELDGPEPPGLDGSALGFVVALVEAGAALQPKRRAVWTPRTPVVASKAGATIVLHPGDAPTLDVSYVLDYGRGGPIPRQAVSAEIRPDTFVQEIAGCRTFLLEEEAAVLRAQGVGPHLTPADVVVFGPVGVIGNRLRFADEPARHKILDLLGDLALTGVDLAGHVVAYRSGHALNVELAKLLARQIPAAKESFRGRARAA